MNLRLPIAYFLSCLCIVAFHRPIDNTAQKRDLDTLNWLARQYSYVVNQNDRMINEIEYLRFRANATNIMHTEWAYIVDAAWKYGKKWDVPENLVLAIIHRESNFSRFAVSSAGAYGLMQVRHSIWGAELELSQDDLMDIDKNIDAGCRILRQYYDENNSWADAILKFNCGYKLSNPDYVKRIWESKFYKGIK